MRQLRSSIGRGVMTVLASAALSATAAAQTTVTINAPNTQVVYATLRGGTYANTNIDNLLETRAASDASYTRRAMLKFDTENTIPAGRNVTSAIMTLTVKNATAGMTRHVAAYQVKTSWTESETTWKLRRSGQSWGTAGGDLGTKLATSTVSDAAGSRVSFDITPLVKQAVAGQLGSSRYTRIALVDTDSPTNVSYRAYATPEDSNTSARPKLTVTYGSSTSTSTSTSSPAPSTSGSTLKVLQYNVHHGGIGTDGVYKPSRIIDWIVKINPDVVSLSEMESWDSYDSGDGVAQYVSALESKTGVKWHSLSIQDQGDWSSGGIRNAILSKLPISATYRHEFSVGRDRTVGGITVNVNGRNVNIMSTHLDPYDASNRISQVKQLASYSNGFAEDRIVLGDFNALPSSTEINTFNDTYYDAWAQAVKAGTDISAPDNPNGYTRNGRIDYVFYSHGEQHLTLRSVQVVDTRDSNGVMPSDHRPLVAKFTVQ
jgi:endonuclease/exonuclease/phosphatase family metal-dependent hydrolase